MSFRNPRQRMSGIQFMQFFRSIFSFNPSILNPLILLKAVSTRKNPKRIATTAEGDLAMTACRVFLEPRNCLSFRNAATLPLSFTTKKSREGIASFPALLLRYGGSVIPPD